jgi:hypothetical protein
MVTVLKRKLSGSTDGKPILVAATSNPGDTIHTAVAGTTAGTFDEIWLWAMNIDTISHLLSIEIGGSVGELSITIPPQSGAWLVMPGWILQNGAVVKAFADLTNKIYISGFVNTMTDA